MKYKPDMTDIFGLAGVGLVAGGAWWIYPPAGVILAGLFCLFMCYVGIRARAGKRR